MANWKKVIVSGSNAVLAEVTASGGFKGDGSGITGISADSLSNALTVDDATIQLDSGTTFNGSAGRTISIKDGGVDADALATGVAGTGLAGGGGTALSVDLNELTAGDVANGDSIVFIDANDSNATKKEAVADLATLFAGGGSSMLTATNSALSVDLNQAAAAAVDVAADSIAIIDANDSNGTKKEAIADVVSGITGNGLAASSGVIAVGAGTGIDVGTNDISVDVSDFMTNGANNRIVTATGTDAMNGEANLTFDGTILSITGNVTASAGFTGSFTGDGSGLTGVTGEVNIDGLSALGGTGLHQTQDHFIFSDNGTEKKITFSNLEDAIFANIDSESTEVAMAAGGRLTIENDAIDNDKLANIARGSVKVGGTSNAPTDLDAKTSGQILVGDGTDVNSVAVSGDIALAANGAVTIQANAVEGSMLNSNTAGSGLSYGSNQLSVDLSGESSHTIGAGTSEITIGDNLTVTGDLTVNGDRNIVSTTNLLVEDKFITLASGSTAAGDGGIVVQAAANGTGAALVWDTGVDRWALSAEAGLSGLATSVDASTATFDYIVGVSGSGNDPAVAGTPTLGASNHQYGQMHVNTSTGDIFIYS